MQGGYSINPGLKCKLTLQSVLMYHKTRLLVLWPQSPAAFSFQSPSNEEVFHLGCQVKAVNSDLMTEENLCIPLVVRWVSLGSFLSSFKTLNIAALEGEPSVYSTFLLWFDHSHSKERHLFHIHSQQQTNHLQFTVICCIYSWSF